MEAVARGVSEAGGRCIGITVRDAPWGEPTAWAAEIVRHDDLLIRMRDLLMGSDAWIALPGQIGTLAEVTVGWVLLSSRLVSVQHLILLGPRWRDAIAGISRQLQIPDRYRSFLTFVDTPEEALERLSA
jgi:predicted Rossmann-fold nucleotide-binding protein